MTKVLLIVSFVYMLVVAALLAFAAIWVCDGYYPVGWGWKGASFHLAFWAMPISLVAGAFMCALGIRKLVANSLLLAGSVPFIVAIAWTQLQSQPSGALPSTNYLSHLFTIAAVFASIATSILIRSRTSSAPISPELPST